MPTASRKAMAACLLLVGASPCLAQGQPNTRSMSCRSAAALVSTRGAVVLNTGPTTYDRYVSGEGYCNVPEEVSMPAFVSAADKQQCFIGYYCISRPVGTGP